MVSTAVETAVLKGLSPNGLLGCHGAARKPSIVRNNNKTGDAYDQHDMIIIVGLGT